MSKVVTFINSNTNFSITRAININDANLTIPDYIFNKIIFSNDAKIIITDNTVLQGNLLNLLINTDIIEFVERIDALKNKTKINVCNRVWSGYDRYKKFTRHKCNTECENITCDRYENYSNYLKMRQIKGIGELRVVMGNGE